MQLSLDDTRRDELAGIAADKGRCAGSASEGGEEGVEELHCWSVKLMEMDAVGHKIFEKEE